MKRLLVCTLLLSGCTQRYALHDTLPTITDSSAPTEVTGEYISYLLQTHKTDRAIDNILKTRSTYLLHSDVLQTLGSCLIEQGVASNNPEDILLSLHGAGISCNENAVKIVQEVVRSDNPYLQLTAINVLSSLNTNAANEAITEAMKSDYPMVRLEAVYHLAMKKHARAYEQIDALALKLPQELRPLLPQLYALENSMESFLEIKKLMYDSDQETRVEAIRALHAFSYDDLITDLKDLLHDPSPAIQEAVAWTLGGSRDERARPLLEQMSASREASLAASFALYQLGDQSVVAQIEQAARSDTIFAIALLGKIPDADPTILYEKLSSENVAVVVNATVALLERKDRHAIHGLPLILLRTPQDFAFQPLSSPGKALSAWKVVPSARENIPQEAFAHELTLRMREEVLFKTLDLPEDDFLEVASMIFATHQRELLPQLVQLLEQLNSPKAIALLTDQEQRLGLPAVRAWCNLALFRMHAPGPWGENLRHWISQAQEEPLFQPRPMLPWKIKPEQDRHTLTMDETSLLLIESFAALAAAQDTQGLESLLQAIQNGNQHNRYTLAGLLMRASQ